MEINEIIDPRVNRRTGYISWDLFRRKQLENICLLEGIKINDGVSAVEMRTLLMARDVNAQKYAGYVSLGALHQDDSDPRYRTLNEEVAKLELEQEHKTIEQKLVDVDFTKMKMPELRAECKLMGIDWKRTEKKVDLIKKIQDKMNDYASGRS